MNIRTTLSFILLILVLFFVSDVFAQKSKKVAPQPKARLRAETHFGVQARVKPCAAQIESVLRDTIFKHAFVGIKVVSLKRGKVIFQHNAEKLFRPASNLKLFTTATALAMLGKDFQFKTEVYTDSIYDGIVKGSIYLKGYGDPLLTTAHLDSLARQIYESGVREVQGDVVGDVSYFDDVFWGKGWMWDDDPGYWWPYLSPLSVNGNTIAVKVTPGFNEGDSVSVVIEPSTLYVTVLNRGYTSTDTTKPRLTATRLWRERQNVIIAEGAARPDASPSAFRLNVWKPELYTLTLFKERLQTYGVTVRGIVRLDTVRNAIRLSSINHPLDSVITFINKESENLASEHLLKTLAAELKGPPGNADTAITIMKQYLTSIGIDTAITIIADGSGVSRYNLVSPNAIIQLLIHQYRNPSTAPVRRTPFGEAHEPMAHSERFIQSLPVAGVDGTLKNRMTSGPARSNARAKTGTHSDVSALSGYVTNAKGDMLAFSLLFNHFPQNVELYRKAQDRIVEILIHCK